jgi:hypothetical protein
MLTLFEFFSGIGGWSEAALMSGDIKPIGCSEIHPYKNKVYELRHPGVPNYGDIIKITNAPYADIYTVSFPCTVKALKMSVAGFGLTQKELLGKIDLNTLSLRTAQYLLDEAWREYSQDLPKSGMMRSGVVYRAINSVSNNTVKGYILLPTPIKHDAKCSVRTDQYFGNLNRKLFRNLAEFLRDGPTDGKYPNPVLSEVLMTFPPLYTDLSASVTRSYL